MSPCTRGRTFCRTAGGLCSACSCLALPARGWTYLASLDSPDRTQLVETESSNTVYSAGHLLFLRGSTLIAQPFDPDRAVLNGDAYPVAEGLHALCTVPVGVFSASQNGVLVYQSGSIVQGSELVWFDRKGTRQDKVAERGLLADIRMSRDGTRVAYSKRTEGAAVTSDIWILDTTTGRTSRATFDAGLELAAAWSADGKQLAFNSNRHGVLDIFMKPSDGSGTETELWRSDQSKFPVDWTADGRHLLVVTGIDGGRGRPGGPTASPPGSASRGAAVLQRLWALPLEGERKPFPASPGTGNETPGGFSPDPAGRWLTYVVQRRRPQRGLRRAVPADGQQVADLDGRRRPAALEPRRQGDLLHPARSADGHADGRARGRQWLGRQGHRHQPALPVHASRCREATYGVMPDGQRFLINTPASTDQPATLPPPTVVINWPSWRGK